MAEIIAQFADGRLLVQEDKPVELDYLSGGVKVRIGHVKLRDVLISGDTLLVLMSRIDQPPAAKRQDKEQCNLTR